MENSNVLKNGVLKTDDVLKTVFKGDHLNSKYVNQVKTFLKLCDQKFTEIETFIKCLKENHERFGFNRLPEIDPSVKFAHPLRSYFMKNKDPVADQKCYNETKLQLEITADIFVSFIKP